MQLCKCDGVKEFVALQEGRLQFGRSSDLGGTEHTRLVTTLKMDEKLNYELCLAMYRTVSRVRARLHLSKKKLLFKI